MVKNGKKDQVCCLKDGTDGVKQRHLTRCLLCIATTSLLPMKLPRIKPSIEQYNRFSYIYGMLYCSSECGSISIMHAQLRTIYCNTYMYIHFMCAYVYLHLLHLFVIPLIY